MCGSKWIVLIYCIFDFFANNNLYNKTIDITKPTTEATNTINNNDFM